MEKRKEKPLSVSRLNTPQDFRSLAGQGDLRVSMQAKSLVRKGRSEQGRYPPYGSSIFYEIEGGAQEGFEEAGRLTGGGRWGALDKAERGSREGVYQYSYLRRK
jgi:hypothetical protein